MQSSDIVEIVRYHSYHPVGDERHCPICNRTLEHSITLVGKDRNGEEHEVHAECMA